MKGQGTKDREPSETTEKGRFQQFRTVMCLMIYNLWQRQIEIINYSSAKRLHFSLSFENPFSLNE